MILTRAGTAGALVAVTLLVAAVYAPGLNGPFLLDDFPNFVNHPLAAIARLDLESLRNAAFSNDSGPSGRPLAALSFSLNYWFAGQRFDPFWFKATNLAIHLINTLLVFAVVRRLLPALLRDELLSRQTAALAVLLAAAWALAPIQLTSVLYVVQRMTSLAALCTLGGVLLYLVGRERLADGAAGGVAIVLAGIAGGVGVGLWFKETALLLPLYLFVVEYAALDRRSMPLLARRFVHALFTLMVLLPAAVLLAAWAARPALLEGMFGGRPFTLGERLLTETRVLFDYLGMLLVPRPDAFGLFHDDLVLSRALLDPPTTALAVAGWVLLAVAAVVTRMRGNRLLAFGFGWFLAGHALESTIFPLELMFEHRNYLPSLGVLCVVLSGAALGVRHLAGAVRPALLVTGALALAPGGLTLARAATWGDAATLVASTVRHQPGSARAQLLAGQYAFATDALGDAYEHFGRAARLADDDVTALLGMLRIVVQARADTAGAEAVAQASGVDGYDAPLVLDGVYLAALQSRIETEIARRLSGGLLPAGSQVALSRLRDCIQAGARDCVPLVESALRWFERLAGRAELPAQVRSMMAADHARVLVAAGRQREALDWLQMAWQLGRDNLQVLVLTAVVQLALGDIDAARASAAQLAGLRGAVGFDARQLEDLREAIDSAGDRGAVNTGAGAPAQGDAA